VTVTTPTKPLFVYLVPLLRLQEALTTVREQAEVLGQWPPLLSSPHSTLSCLQLLPTLNVVSWDPKPPSRARWYAEASSRPFLLCWCEIPSIAQTLCSGGALPFGGALVFGGALPFGGALVFGGALPFGGALVSGGGLVVTTLWVDADALGLRSQLKLATGSMSSVRDNLLRSVSSRSQAPETPGLTGVLNGGCALKETQQ